MCVLVMLFAADFFWRNDSWPADKKNYRHICRHISASRDWKTEAFFASWPTPSDRVTVRSSGQVAGTTGRCTNQFLSCWTFVRRDQFMQLSVLLAFGAVTTPANEAFPHLLSGRGSRSTPRSRVIIRVLRALAASARKPDTSMSCVRLMLLMSVIGRRALAIIYDERSTRAPYSDISQAVCN